MHRKLSARHLWQLLACCLLALASVVNAAQEEITLENGKAYLVSAMLENTVWPDEGKIDRFVIGLYGRDAALRRALARMAPSLTIRGKPVVVKHFNTIARARAAHVLLVSEAKNGLLEKIERELHLSLTLVVTDGSDDPRHVMVNFTHPSETRLSFEINRSNIIYAGLQLSKTILLFGGTELDAATIYKETQAELVVAKAVATEQQQELETQRQHLAEQEDTIKRQSAQVEANRMELATLEQQLSGIEATLEHSETRLRDNETALVEKETVLAEKEAYIESYTRKIEHNLERLEDQQAELKQQEGRIDEQNSVLVKQLSTIENQQFILAAAAAALLLVLFLIAIIFRSYRSKHNINLKLEGKTRELEVANRHLVKATDSKSLFLSTMSHEIRTPMNGVIGMAELLEGTPLNSQQREYLSLITNSADTLLGLINDILDFSKIEAGRLDFEAIPFNLRDVLGDTLQGLGLRAAEKGLELACRIPPQVPNNLIGDPTRLRQVVVNLVGNAIKFTESGEVTVALKLESQSGDLTRVAFSVRDSGIGISERQQRRIFEAFGQADSSTTREFGGTGLGLAICSQLVDMMGGKLMVTSEAGRGSTFSFSGDFGLSEDLPEALPYAEKLGGQRLLLVEDNTTTRVILEEMLSDWGVLVTAVNSGDRALVELELAEREGGQFALVLVSAIMPGMDGFELAGRLRQRPETEALPILMLTASGRPDQEALRNRLNIARILLKPAKHGDLLRAVSEALGVGATGEDADDAQESKAPVLVRQVLLVEDNPVNQKVASDLLARRGHAIEVARNGEEALDMLQQREFDIILMDVHMPVMDGLAATRAIREREQADGGHIHIVAITAGATTDDRARCFEAGMDEFVTKPFRAAELYERVESVTPHAPGSAEPVSIESPQAEAGSDHECLDWRSALHNLEGDEDLLLELVEMYRAQYPQLMSGITQAIAVGAAAQLQLSAHTLKGSARMIGGLGVAEAALKLENMGRDKHLEAALPAFYELQEKVAELEVALQSVTPLGESTAVAD